jgi:dCMP deaminase
MDQETKNETTALQTRPSWDEYFMMLTKLVATMGTCKKRKVGAVVTRNRRILTTGFNGAPPGMQHCTEAGCLIFEEEGSSCRRVLHAEQNAILQNSANLEGATLYTSFIPCIDCMKEIVTAKVTEVVYEEEYPGTKPRYTHAKEFAMNTNVRLRKIAPVSIVEVLKQYYP